jgi:hypothetical protein
MADQKTAYHIADGATTMYVTDANNAVAQHPNEWAFQPWPIEETNAYKRAMYDKAVADARRRGEPEPEPPVEYELADEDQAVIDTDEQLRQEARELVAEDDARIAEELDYKNRVTAARALLAQPAPQPAALAAERAARTGYVRPDAAKAPVAEPALPENWRDRNNAARLGMARRLSGNQNIKQKEADAFLEEYEAKNKAQSTTQTAQD